MVGFSGFGFRGSRWGSQEGLCSPAKSRASTELLQLKPQTVNSEPPQV